jgi:hypothetical protein
MATESLKGSQIHVGVTDDLKKAVKMFCVPEGTTEQSWAVGLLEADLAKRAADPWSAAANAKRKRAGR